MGQGPSASDFSKLMGIVRELPKNSRISVVDFAGSIRARINDMPISQISIEDFKAAKSQIDPMASDHVKALRAAASIERTLDDKKYLFVSDGWVSSTHAPTDFGAYWLPVQPDISDQDVAITEVSSPTLVHPDEVFAVTASISGLQSGFPIDVGLFLNEKLVQRQSNQSGKPRFDLKLRDPGPHIIRVQLLEGPYGVSQNDTRSVAVDVIGNGQVLYVSAQQVLPQAARDLRTAGWPVQHIHPQEFPEAQQVWDHGTLVVLDNIAVQDLSEPAVLLLGRAVRDAGVGLIVLGGNNAFAGGGYLGSTLEDLLPVISEDAKRTDETSVVFAVDKSGSMAKQEFGTSRFDYALEAAEKSLGGLSERDRSGLIFFDRVPQVAADLKGGRQTFFENQSRAAKSPGGGTRFVEALELAKDQLVAEENSGRLIVLITDGVENELSDNLDALRQSLFRDEISVVTILIGQSSTPEQLSFLRELSGGKLLRANSAAELPQIVRSELDAWKTPARLGQSQVSGKKDLPFPFTAEIFPPVHGYMVTRARPEAMVFLESDRRDPILASGLAGAGRVAVLTSGIGNEWTRGWLNENMAPELLSGLATWVTSDQTDSRLHIAITQINNELKVVAETLDVTGDWASEDRMDFTIQSPDGNVVNAQRNAQAPGLYEYSQPITSDGVYLVAVRGGDVSGRRAYYANPPELEVGSDDTPFVDRPLGQVPLMRILTPGDSLIDDDWPRETMQLQPYLLALALALYLLTMGFEAGLFSDSWRRFRDRVTELGRRLKKASGDRTAR